VEGRHRGRKVEVSGAWAEPASSPLAPWLKGWEILGWIREEGAKPAGTAKIGAGLCQGKEKTLVASISSLTTNLR